MEQKKRTLIIRKLIISNIRSNSVKWGERKEERRYNRHSRSRGPVQSFTTSHSRHSRSPETISMGYQSRQRGSPFDKKRDQGGAPMDRKRDQRGPVERVLAKGSAENPIVLFNSDRKGTEFVETTKTHLPAAMGSRPKENPKKISYPERREGQKSFEYHKYSSSVDRSRIKTDQVD